MIYRPIILDEEVVIPKKSFLVSKTDIQGKVIYVNKSFCEVTGYSEDEIVGEPHDVVRHPDTPRAIFYLLWESLLSGNDSTVVFKNLAKSGKYYWVISNLSNITSKQNKVELTSFSYAASAYVTDIMEELYDEMILAEKKNGIEGSLLLLEIFLAEKEMNYQEFIEELIKPRSILTNISYELKNALQIFWNKI